MENIELELRKLMNLIKEAEQYNKRQDIYRSGKTLKMAKRKISKIQNLIKK